MLLFVMCLFLGVIMCGVWWVEYGMLVLGDAAAARWDGAGVGACAWLTGSCAACGVRHVVLVAVLFVDRGGLVAHYIRL